MDPITTPNAPIVEGEAPAPDTTGQAAAPNVQSPFDWKESIPAGSEKLFDSFKGKQLSDVFKSYAEAQSLIGGSIRLPKEGATPDDRSKIMGDVYDKLGRPKTAEEYKDLPSLEVAAGVQIDDAQVAEVKGVLHQLGLTNEQAKGVFGLYAKELNKLFPDPSVAAATSRESLVEHYGSEPMMIRNLNFAQTAVKKFGDEATVNFLEQTGLGNDANFVKFMAKIGRELVEHGAMNPSESTLSFGSDEAQSKIDKVMTDKTDAYHDRMKPGHERRVQEVSNWYKIIAGEA